jgi:hypothetical protein
VAIDKDAQKACFVDKDRGLGSEQRGGGGLGIEGGKIAVVNKREPEVEVEAGLPDLGEGVLGTLRYLETVGNGVDPEEPEAVLQGLSRVVDISWIDIGCVLPLRPRSFTKGNLGGFKGDAKCEGCLFCIGVEGGRGGSILILPLKG